MRDLSCSSSCKVWKEQHDQYDLRYRLLSLLLHLADSPVNNVYEPPAPLDEEREAQVDLKLHSLAVSTIFLFRLIGLLCSEKERKNLSLGVTMILCQIGQRRMIKNKMMALA